MRAYEGTSANLSTLGDAMSNELPPDPRAAPAPGPLFGAADGRALAEAALRAITASTSRARGDDFLRLMVRELAAALDVRYVIAGRLIAMADGHEG
ncbi:MAG: hypothetical protein ABIQ08_14095, partial [Duganella sp.]